MPKKPKSAYLLYKDSKYDKLKMANKDLAYGEICKQIHEDWGNESDEVIRMFEERYELAKA